jgi:hypothetical protein
MWNWNALIVRNGYQRHFPVLLEKLPQIRRVHHSVHRGDCGDFISAHQGEMDIVAVKVNHVELTYVSKDEFKHSHMMRENLAHLGIAPECPWTHLHEPRSRLRVSARKQGYVMSEPYELLGEIGDDPFGAAVKGWRHGLVQ